MCSTCLFLFWGGVGTLLHFKSKRKPGGWLVHTCPDSQKQTQEGWSSAGENKAEKWETSIKKAWENGGTQEIRRHFIIKQVRFWGLGSIRSDWNQGVLVNTLSKHSRCVFYAFCFLKQSLASLCGWLSGRQSSTLLAGAKNMFFPVIGN